MKGFSVTHNAMGITAVRLHYTADPTKDPETEGGRKWLDAQRMQWPDPNDFQREFEINFFVTKGTRVFPQFSQAIHVRECKVNRRRVIYRSWDFGWHCPACIIAQIDNEGRLLILAELVGRQQTTHEFAERVIARCAEWFPNHAAGFEDFCDPAGQHIQSLESERNERRDIEVLAGLGIHPRYEFGWSRKDGRTAVHRLLALRSDGTPGMYVDYDGAPTVVQAFLGRYVFPETRAGKVSDEPDDTTHPWADVMATARYLVIGLRNKLAIGDFSKGAARSRPLTAPAFHGYGTPLTGGHSAD